MKHNIFPNSMQSFSLQRVSVLVIALLLFLER